MYRPLIWLLALTTLGGSISAQVVYTKDNAVYVLPCDKTGQPSKGAKPIKICNLWPDQEKYVYRSIGWVAPGKIWLVHEVAKGRSTPRQSIYLLDAKARSKPIKLTDGWEPAFSPDGSTMAYATSDFNGDIRLFSLRTRRKTLKIDHAESPDWSGDGKAFVYVSRDKELDGIVTIRSYPDGKLIRTLRPQASPELIFLSHDASKAAVEFHLSRPKMGHTVFDFKTKSEISLGGPDRFAPPEIDDWSPDETHFLSSYRTIDPNNDGAWIESRLGLTSIKGAQLKLVSIGYQGRFAPDGQHILYITDHKTGMFNKHGDLIWESLQDGSKEILVRNVTDFAVFRPR